jgi:hypothetical protein
MAQHHQKRGRAAIIGAHRGGRGFVHAAPEITDSIGAIDVIDPKPCRAADLARVIQHRFPAVRTAAYESDGREASRQLADDAVIIGTVDTADGTRALIDSRRGNQTLVFQLVGRGPGPAMTAQRLGISGVVRDPLAQLQASLLFTGFASIAAEASSRVLTRGGDALTAAVLQPLRRETSRQTARYFADVLRDEGIADAPLTFFMSSGRFPLAVRPGDLDDFRNEAAQALELLDGYETQRTGVIAAVALVSLAARAIDILVVSRSRTDRRRVERVMPFRTPSMRFDNATTFTD